MACPICDKETDKTYRPFCSKRCADIDLGKWMSDGYVIESGAPETVDEMPDIPTEAPSKLH